MRQNRDPIEIDMLIDGRFAGPPQSRSNWPMRIAAAAVLVALIAGSIALAAFLLWLIAMLLPLAIAAAVIAWAAYRYQLWRSGGSRGGPGGNFRSRF